MVAVKRHHCYWRRKIMVYNNIWTKQKSKFPMKSENPTSGYTCRKERIIKKLKI